MSIMRYYSNNDPFKHLHGEINRLFETSQTAESSAATADYSPAADINEFADKFEIYLDLPGVNTAEVDVTLENSVLSISGQREPLATAEVVEGQRTERPSGRFHRRFTLPDTVDASAVQASAKNGVLVVSIPKREAVKARRIAVQ